MKIKKVLFILEYGTKYGYGHLMRNIALVEQFNKIGIKSYLYSKSKNKNIDTLLKKNKIEKISKKYLMKKDFSSNNLITIIDNYEINSSKISYYKKKLQKLIIIDDYSTKKFKADILINYNLGASKKNYQKSVIKKFLIGAKYCLIRSDFISKNRKSVKKNILITFGAGTFFKQTKKLLLETLNFCKKYNKEIVFNIVVSVKELIYFKKFFKNFNYKIKYIINKTNLSTQMLKCDFAITSAGVSVYELAALGVPFMSFQFAKNQYLTSKKINKLGIGYAFPSIYSLNLKFYKKIFFKFFNDTRFKRKISKKAQFIVSKNGAKNVLKELLKFYKNK